MYLTEKNFLKQEWDIGNISLCCKLIKLIWRVFHMTPFFFFFFFLDLGFISRTLTMQGKGEGIYLTPLYHFHPLHRHLDISWVITTESSPLHIAGSWTRTGNLWFPSASRLPPSYAPLNHQATRPFFCEKKICHNKKRFVIKIKMRIKMIMSMTLSSIDI